MNEKTSEYKETEQYVFQFECLEKWENLTETADEKIRHCQRCSKNVHLVQNRNEFAENAEKGNCVYAIAIRTAGIAIPPDKYEHRKPVELRIVRALPIRYRFFQLVLFFIVALPLVSFLPLFIQKTMTRSQTASGDVIDYGWKFRTFYAFMSNYEYFRPEENFFFWLVMNFGLACLYALVVALVAVWMSILNWHKNSSRKK